MPSLAPGSAPAPAVQATLAPVPREAPVVLQDRVIVTLKAGTAEAEVLGKLAGFARRDGIALGGKTVLSVRPPAGMGLAEAIARLRATPGVARAGEDVVRRRYDFTFNNPDPRFKEQWSHRADRANTTNAWGLVPVAAQAKVVAAVLDSGLDVGHPEFAGRVVGPQNFTTADGVPTTDVTDAEGHGTHVAGILGAAGNNGDGVAGVAWGVQLLPVKVLDDEGAGSDFSILKGLTYAIHYRPTPDDGSRVRVINLSLGSDTGLVSQAYADAVAEATANGVLIVAASGNEGRQDVSVPANTPGVVAVGSSNQYLAWEGVSAFSNGGDRLDLVAPGEGILSTAPRAGSGIGATYATISGTSMATPYVAGVAALIAARYDAANANMTAAYVEKIRRRLLMAVDDMGPAGRDPVYGEGRLNAAKAVTPATIDAAP
jgi:subtilisin family serine protease